MTPADEFVEFAQAAAPRLRRAAFLLCGDWHTAEDLTQSALAKVFVSWRRIRRRDAAHAYATRTLVNTYLADRRLRRVEEVLTARVPDRPAENAGPEDRLLALSALAALPARARAVVAWIRPPRCWVARQAISRARARALDKLRAGLAAAEAETGIAPADGSPRDSKAAQDG